MPTSSYNCEPAVGEIPELTLEEVQSGFNDPVLVTHPPEDARLFVVQRGGLIRIIDGDSIQTEPFLDITAKVENGESEQGLLGLAFHPDYADNGLFYVYYTAKGGTSGHSVLEEYSLLEGSTTQGDPDSVRGIIDEDQPAWNHNGGQVTFGPDGMLYLALGDGGNLAPGAQGTAPDTNGQNTTTLLGSLLRIDVDGREAGAYSIPAGNLKDVMDSAAPEIFSYGLRNPYRYNFDVCTGDLYLGDVGQNSWEEVTITKAGLGQLNYGWNTMEGTHCYSPGNGCDQTGITLPQIEYPRGGTAAVVGGSVYRGSEIPGLRGKYLYADAQKGSVWYSEYNSTTNMATAPINISNELGSGGKAIVSVQNGFDGEIYMTDLVGGIVYKLAALPVD